MATTTAAPFVRDSKATQTAAAPPPKRTLQPFTQSGNVDISDIAQLRGEELRKVLVERAAALRPLLEANASENEQNRRVSDESIAAIREAGLFRIMVPRRFGGLETDIRTKIEVSREVGKADGSTAWVTTLLNVCSLFAGYASDQAQEDIWGKNPDARIAGVFAPLATSRRVEGGLIVTGAWPWASGSLHADWAGVGVPVVNEAGEPVDQALGFFPMSDCTIEDTWYVAGMKATGSNTIVIQEKFIPDYRLMSMPQTMAGNPPTSHKEESLYRSSFVPTAALILVGPMLGLITRAFEFVREKASKRAISYTFYETQVTSPSFQLALAQASMLIDTCHLHAYHAAGVIDEAAAAGRLLSYEERAKIRMHTGYVAKTAREAMDILLSAHGASSFGEGSIMQRMWRDLETCSRHAVVSPEISSEVYGKALVGIEGGVTALV